MNLQESIKRILREEIDMITNLNQLRRRTYLIDKYISYYLVDKMISHYNRKNDNTQQSDDLKKLISFVQERLHGKYFVYSELPDEEWEEIKNFIEAYIKENYKK
jgi:hypothetical protein